MRSSHRRQFLLPLAALLLGAGYLLYAVSGEPPAQVVGVSGQEYLSILEQGIAGPRSPVTGQDAAAVVEKSIARDPGEKHVLEAVFTKWPGRDPLPNVDVVLTGLSTGATQTVKSDFRGHARVEGLAAGRYLVQLAHDSFLPRNSNIHPRRSVVVPGAPINVAWARAYGFAARVVGRKMATARHMLDRNQAFRTAEFFRGEEIAHISEALRRRIGVSEGDLLDVFAVDEETLGANPTAEWAIFDKDKGPCHVNLRVAPVAELNELQIIDLSSFPVVEPMASISFGAYNGLGDSEVDVGALLFVRSEPYHGFRTESVASNATILVPPGTYQVGRSGISYDVAFNPDVTTISVKGGEELIVEARSTMPLQRVMVQVSRNGASWNDGFLAQHGRNGTDNEVVKWSEPIRTASPFELLLPVGRSVINICYGVDGRFEEVRESVSVPRGYTSGNPMLVNISLP